MNNFVDLYTSLFGPSKLRDEFFVREGRESCVRPRRTHPSVSITISDSRWDRPCMHGDLMTLYMLRPQDVWGLDRTRADDEEGCLQTLLAEILQELRRPLARAIVEPAPRATPIRIDSDSAKHARETESKLRRTGRHVVLASALAARPPAPVLVGGGVLVRSACATAVVRQVCGLKVWDVDAAVGDLRDPFLDLTRHASMDEAKVLQECTNLGRVCRRRLVEWRVVIDVEVDHYAR